MVGRIGVGSICDLWVRFVICGCGFVLWCVVGFFFFFSCCGLVVVVVVVGVVVAVADGRVVVVVVMVGAVDFFWVMGFYCSGYIILL